MVDLLIKLACFCKRVKNVCNAKTTEINKLVQADQFYWAFAFIKDSPIKPKLPPSCSIKIYIVIISFVLQ